MSHVGGLSLADPIPGHGVVLLNVTVVLDLSASSNRKHYVLVHVTRGILYHNKWWYR